MNETTVNFNDIQKALEPMFGGKVIKIVWDGKNAVLTSEKQAKKKLTSKGLLHEYANPELIPLEEGAWERAAVEKHEKNIILDANAILRYILYDIPEQADITEEILQKEEVLTLAVKTFGNENLDFVDCLLFAYSGKFDIFTFDEKLSRLIKNKR